MKILAFDVSASNTGWSFLDIDYSSGPLEIKHLEFGNIQPAMTMLPSMKIFFFGNMVNQIVDRFNPDNIVVEEPIQIAKHGFKTSKILSRFNGVCIYEAYKNTKKEVFLFEPTKWRKQIGLSGKCHKVEVQLEVVKRLKLISEDVYSKYFLQIRTLYETLDLSGEIDKLKEQNKIQEKEFKKNKLINGISDFATLKKINNDKMKILKDKLKKEGSKLKKQFEKDIIKIGTELYSITGINLDVADSFGLNFATINEIFNGNN